jgi:transposase
MRFPSDAVNTSVGTHNYFNGPAKKARVVECFEQLMAVDGREPSVEMLRNKAQVSWYYANKVVQELKERGLIVYPKRFPALRAEAAKEPSVHSLDDFDEVVLLEIRREDPYRPLKSYRDELYMRTGSLVSLSTIGSWLLRRFPFRGSTNEVKPENIERYYDFLLWRNSWRNNVEPIRLRFAGEEWLTEAPGLDGGDFHTTYCIMGMMTMDSSKKPIYYTICEGKNDSFTFANLITDGVRSGWFNRGDILVLDINASRDCEELANVLWHMAGPDGHPMNILVVPLPPRSPELNPISVIWNTLSYRLKTVPSYLPKPENHAIAHYAKHILDNMDHELMINSAVQCGY